MRGLLFEKESYDIRGACYKVYRTLRNNHKEIVYHNALVDSLVKMGYQVGKNVRVPVFYEGKSVGVYVPDVVVNGMIVIELKCKPYVTKDDLNQFWYYLKNTPYQVGFLVNFGHSSGVEIHRRIHTNKITKLV